MASEICLLGLMSFRVLNVPTLIYLQVDVKFDTPLYLELLEALVPYLSSPLLCFLLLQLIQARL